MENDGERYDFCVQVHTISGCPVHTGRSRVAWGVARMKVISAVRCLVYGDTLPNQAMLCHGVHLALSRSEVLLFDQEAIAD